jgi:protein-tyrosine-phosphatase
LAAAILRKELSFYKDYSFWQVDSAGSWVKDISPATPEAIFEAQKRDLDLSGHLSKGIEEIPRSSIDVMFVMETGQKESILLDYPKLKTRVFLLSELIGLKYSIPDPYETSESCSTIASEIEVLIRPNLKKILSLANHSNSR